MIFLEHHNGKVTTNDGNKKSLVALLYEWAKKDPKAEFVVHAAGLDPTEFTEAIKNKRGKNSLISSATALHPDFGYVEDTPFIKVNPAVTYPTWKKSTTCFYIHAALVNQVCDSFSNTDNLLYWLNSVAKTVRPQGVFCYQLPLYFSEEKLTTTQVYRFVKQHYKRRWTLILLLCHLIYERRFPLFAFAKAQFSKKREAIFDIGILQETPAFFANVDPIYEVIIPTMGRPDYLHDVLNDFSNQNCLPKRIIIIEQNEDPDSQTDLSFLGHQEWPFQIVHQFIYQTGACHARNLAIAMTTAPWVMFFDDDARFNEDTFERIFSAIRDTNAKVLNTAYLQGSDRENQKTYKQWESFGSGCSMVHRDVFTKCSFDRALEHGYGEDSDYGMQIRNAGYDVIYAPQIQIKHLKAPVGGFRKPVKMPWVNEPLSPRPSPQIMYYRLKNTTVEQLRGYKLILGIKLFPHIGSKNPLRHIKIFKKAWALSLQYARGL